MSEHLTIGLTETVTIFGKTTVEARARIDTGASVSSIDVALAKELDLGPVIKTMGFRSALGRSKRPVIKADIEIAGKKIHAEFSIADRKHMRFPVLLGRNILKEGFLIDPQKKTQK